MITSVGIDIGTSTSQVVFARLTLENTAGYFSVPHIAFAEKEVFYKSPIAFTPLSDDSTLDGEGIRHIVEREYERAGVRSADVETGAVIITGESARKENAAIVTESLAGLAGEFVVSTAGPDLEAVIAGKGSGAARISKERSIAVANLDIGGGTTNIVIFGDGEAIAKGCLDIGGRLVRVEKNRIAYVSESAARIAREANLEIRTGNAADAEELAHLCERMTTLLEESLGLRPASELLALVQTSGSTLLERPQRLDAVCFSGGVADCIDSGAGKAGKADKDPFRFGDIGPLLGAAIARSRFCSQIERVTAEETIRATVVGAGTYTTSVSGSTILQHPELLPMKNLPALKLSHAEAERCYEGDADFLAGRVAWFLEQSDAGRLVLAMDGDPNPSYERLKRLANCIAAAAERTLRPGEPLILAMRSDTAKALGQTIESICGTARAVICIDDVQIEQGDYVDLGRPMMDGMVLPVVIKTLAFG